MFWSLKFDSKDYSISKQNIKGTIKIAIRCNKTKKVVHRIDQCRFKIVDGYYHITR